MLRKKPIYIVGAALIFAIAIIVVSQKKFTPVLNPNDLKTSVGHTGNPLLSFLYLSFNADSFQENFIPHKFNTSADIGYGLLTGSIGMGFIEPERVERLKKLAGFENIEVIGKVTFPYGASLVVKKGSALRLSELKQHKIAVTSDKSPLLREFKSDLEKYGIDVNQINFVVLAADAIIPALETGNIDGALVEGSQAVIAQKAGHFILYQKWEIESGNDCCPVIIDQIEFLLLAHNEHKEKALQLSQQLILASGATPSELRQAISKALNIPEETLAELPLASYSAVDNAPVELFDMHHGANHKPTLQIEEFVDKQIHDEHCGTSLNNEKDI